MAEVKYNSIWKILTENNYGDAVDIDTDMRCTICTRILINAHNSVCGCRYCLECVKAYLNGERRFCPGNTDDCKAEQLDIDSKMAPDHAMNYRISKLIVKCRYSCGCRCELRNMEEHERTCQRQSVDCPYLNVGCRETRLVSDRINEHLVGENESHARLLMTCIDRLENEIALMKIETVELRKTQAQEMQLLTEKLGKLERQMQTEKEEHVRNIDDMHHKEAGRLANIEKRMSEIGIAPQLQNWGEFVWSIDGWAAKQQSAKDGTCTQIFSDPFFSRMLGYKMFLSVDPDGYSGGQGTHLCVGAGLMRGPFDNMLSWPFRSDVTLSIVNQHTGADYVSYTFKYNDFPNNTCRNKPKNVKNVAFHHCKLIELAALSSTFGLCWDDKLSIKCIVK